MVDEVDSPDDEGAGQCPSDSPSVSVPAHRPPAASKDGESLGDDDVQMDVALEAGGVSVGSTQDTKLCESSVFGPDVPFDHNGSSRVQVVLSLCRKRKRQEECHERLVAL